MSSPADIVITGLGIACPLGIGQEAVWNAVCAGRSGVSAISRFDVSGMPFRFGAEVRDLDAKKYIKPRKSIKLMCREIQFGYSAAQMALDEAGIDLEALDHDRFGVVYGGDMMKCDLEEVEASYRACLEEGSFDFSRWGNRALGELFPLWMLKYLPNMTACHVAIGLDARGPNNTHVLGDVSGLAALYEALHLIRRGAADVVICGSAGSRIDPTNWVRSTVAEMSHRNEDPAGAMRPFDRDRDGTVNGEGAAAIVLESAPHAAARGAKVLGRVLSASSRFAAAEHNGTGLERVIQAAMESTLRTANLKPEDIGHVNAHGLSTTLDDQREARAIRAVLGDVPVTAPKSYFGNLGAGAGIAELAFSVMGFNRQVIPPTLNYSTPDPACPINVVNHCQPEAAKRTALVLNHASTGQAFAAALAAE